MNKNAIKLIGNTPLFNIDNTSIYVKLERFNLGGSVKDRAVLGMLNAAFKQNAIHKDTILVEPTSGNTGISLAMLGAIYGIKVVIVMPESMSIERRQLIKAYGAQLILTPKEKGTNGAIEKAQEILDNNPNALMLQQFTNPNNPLFHYQTTAQEILDAVPNIDYFVAGVGSAGTISGVGKYLKETKPEVQVIAVEPEESALLSGGSHHPHPVQGIGAGFIPENYNQSIVDDVIKIKGSEAVKCAKSFIQKYGVAVGISSGAAIKAAFELEAKNPGKTIVVIAPDGIEKYISVLDFDDVKYV